MNSRRLGLSSSRGRSGDAKVYQNLAESCPPGHAQPHCCSMSASLIGRLGSSTFRPSAAAVSMSLTGSCFSSESAPRPFHHGIRGRGGAIFGAFPLTLIAKAMASSPSLSIVFRRGERVWASAAVFEKGSFCWTKPPAKQLTLVDGMKRVDKHHAPSEWNSSGDTPAAKLRDNVSCGSAGEASLGHPC
jgi:hypothetical protein